MSTALHAAADKGHTECVRVLLDRGNTIIIINNTNATTFSTITLTTTTTSYNSSTTPFTSSTITSTTTISTSATITYTKLIMIIGADINCKDGQNFTPLHLSARSNHIECFKLLVERGGDIDKSQLIHYPIEYKKVIEQGILLFHF